MAELEEMARLICRGEPAEIRPLALKSPFRPLFDSAQFCGMVERGTPVYL